jgi:hypothetical protein
MSLPGRSFDVTSALMDEDSSPWSTPATLLTFGSKTQRALLWTFRRIHIGSCYYWRSNQLIGRSSETAVPGFRASAHCSIWGSNGRKLFKNL